MASISNDPGGNRRILFVDKNQDRKSVRLGKVSKKIAEEVKGRIEAIAAAARAGHSIDAETAAWLGKIGDGLHAKLAAVGLVQPRQAPATVPTLGEFLEGYIAGRTDVKKRTTINLDAARRRLVDYFGPDKTIDAINPGDAVEWLIWLKKSYADGTIARTVKRAKQFFIAAIDKKIITENPFKKLKPPDDDNPDRKFFVALDAAYRVLEACPDAEWRLLFALSRFGGLRCPSEHLAIGWQDVDWERNRFRVDSPKTGVRWVPIFPELRPYLEEAFDLAPEGAAHVIRRCRDSNANLRTQLMRIIKRAGLEPWPKLFQNLRASRETELMKHFPVHVVCEWMGHDALIAQKHYLQITDADFDRAATMPVPSAPKTSARGPAEGGAKSGALLPKSGAKTGAASSGTERAPNAKTPEKPEFSAISADFSEVDDYPRQDSNL